MNSFSKASSNIKVTLGNPSVLDKSHFVLRMDWSESAGKDQEDDWASASWSWWRHLFSDRAQLRIHPCPTLPEFVTPPAEGHFSTACSSEWLLLWCAWQNCTLRYPREGIWLTVCRCLTAGYLPNSLKVKAHILVEQINCKSPQPIFRWSIIRNKSKF